MASRGAVGLQAVAALECTREANLMEVCGTHSHAIARHGIKQLLPETVRLISGPGCPVCVTPTGDIDLAIELAHRPEVTLATFGDMMRVPGSESSLELARAHGGDVRTVYCPTEASALAAEYPDRLVVFLGVGFETTAPMVAGSVLEAERCDLDNYVVLCCHKLIPPAMDALLATEDVRIDGFLCPGHVSTIIGMEPYERLVARYRVPCVVAGFEPLEIVEALRLLLLQIERGIWAAENAYPGSVRPDGNPRARAVLETVFESTDARWRGLGMIPGSGLRIRERYARFDAVSRLGLDRPRGREPEGCACGEILRGVKAPADCPLFGDTCVPQAPVGPCMVSSEGACAAAYRYER